MHTHVSSSGAEECFVWECVARERSFTAYAEISFIFEDFDILLDGHSTL